MPRDAAVPLSEAYIGSTLLATTATATKTIHAPVRARVRAAAAQPHHRGWGRGRGRGWGWSRGCGPLATQKNCRVLLVGWNEHLDRVTR